MNKISVSELNDSISNVLSSNYKKQIIVVGEVSNPKISGNTTYMTLKDHSASISVKFFGMRLMTEAKHGDNVEITGSVNYYSPYGTICVIGKKIEKIEGTGSIHSQYEKIKEEYQKKGYFNNAKQMPDKVKNIGVVTAENGAALQDFIRVLRNNNFNGTVYIYNAVVQGPRCPDSVADGIKFFDTPFYSNVENITNTSDSNSDSDSDPNSEDCESDTLSVSDPDTYDPFASKVSKVKKSESYDEKNNLDMSDSAQLEQVEVDVVVITRGGGEFEHLMGFSDPKVLEAIYKSKRYTISSVGHEVDKMLSDFVANCSVGTPSMAGDIISKAFNSSFQRLNEIEKKIMRIKQDLMNKLYTTRQEVTNIKSKLVDPKLELLESIVAIKSEAESRLRSHIGEYLKRNRDIINRIALHDSVNLLSNGFSVLVSMDGKVIRKTEDIFDTPIKLIHGTGEYNILIKKLI